MSSKAGAKPKKHRPLTNNAKIINPYRQVDKSAAHLRSRATIKRLAMYKQKAHYNREGKFMGGAFMNREVDEPVKRIAPDRRWFGNTRVIGQSELEKFREQMNEKLKDPYTVILKQQQLPMALLNDPYQKARPDLLSTESFDETFGPKAQRKKPKLAESMADLAAMAAHAEVAESNYDPEKDAQRADMERDYMKEDALEAIFKKGTSKRIWNELYKVIDASDVVVQVLDVRDPMGTRCKRIEDELKRKERRHKHMVLILNKCDLVPTWVTRRWVKLLSREYPTLAFHASITNPFGKGSLLQLLRQFGRLHDDQRQISVGFVGYPNVGKSSVINAIRGANVCPAAPIPGETKTWRYITLFKRIFLIDCPGVVYPFGNTPTDCVLKGVVRMEQLQDPADYIGAILERVRPQYIVQHYGVTSWKNHMDFLKKLAVKTGKLLKQGEPDINNVARIVLADWQMGRLPYFVCPPFEEDLDGGKGLFDLQKLQRESVRQASTAFGSSSNSTEDDEEEKGDAEEKEMEDDYEEDMMDDAFDEDAEEDDMFFGEEDEDQELEFEELTDEVMARMTAAAQKKKPRIKTEKKQTADEDEEEPFDEFAEFEEERALKKRIQARELARKRREEKLATKKIVVEDQDFSSLLVKTGFAGADLDELAYYEEMRKAAAASGKPAFAQFAAPPRRKRNKSRVAEVSAEPLLKMNNADGPGTSGADPKALLDITPMEDQTIHKKRLKLVEKVGPNAFGSGALLQNPLKSGSTSADAKTKKK